MCVFVFIHYPGVYGFCSKKFLFSGEKKIVKTKCIQKRSIFVVFLLFLFDETIRTIILNNNEITRHRRKEPKKREKR